MAKKAHIVRYSGQELAAKRQRGETRSDWARAAAMTDREIEADIASDPEEAGMAVDWDSVTVELPKPKADLHIASTATSSIIFAVPARVTRPASTPFCDPTSRACVTNKHGFAREHASQHLVSVIREAASTSPSIRRRTQAPQTAKKLDGGLTMLKGADRDFTRT